MSSTASLSRVCVSPLRLWLQDLCWVSPGCRNVCKNGGLLQPVTRDGIPSTITNSSTPLYQPQPVPESDAAHIKDLKTEDPPQPSPSPWVALSPEAPGGSDYVPQPNLNNMNWFPPRMHSGLPPLIANDSSTVKTFPNFQQSYTPFTPSLFASATPGPTTSTIGENLLSNGTNNEIGRGGNA
jgi:hypothetical protein